MVGLSRLAAAAALCLAAAPAVCEEQAGARFADAFLEGDVDALWAAMTPEMKEAVSSRETFEEIRAEILAELGEEVAVRAEITTHEGGLEIYRRIGRWSGTDRPVEIRITLDAAGNVAGFWVRPQAVAVESRFLDYRTKADLRLPVSGKWYVVWGGRSVEENYHAVDPAQRFAMDLLVLEDGESFAGDRTDLSSYHCWGREVRAPAAGKIVRAVGDLSDQPIDATDATHPAGNHVVIDFGSGEFGFLAHFQAGSVAVAEGDTVGAGDLLGLCGNSGNTTEPHLHFHLQTTPILGDGEGLPAQFLDYVADGGDVARGEPARGQTVSPAK
ncbi:peptidoglycan DD-metalloendopeptidase family protein [Tropicimonas sp. IMCC34011]|uniref:peptidoglycan DD-metalloendopeptidase family protein n=1 Tax=Tropicimonas sp. IMCC34011 TaxID=2248759 RepID=UPI000E2271E7|nr:peptidoglycan DD-metalloendopeptidase family protein [Tropicimonas sp. IMCC34011]